MRSPVRLALRGLGLLAAVGFIALLAYGLVAQSPDGTIDDSLARAEATPAPAFTLDVLAKGQPPARLRAVVARATRDGKVSLEELRGTPVVLNFWASWCDPCRAEAPILERGWRDAGRQGVLFVGLGMQDATSDANEFLRGFDVSYLNVREGGDDTARRYGVTGLPETFFISARGQVVAHVIGAISADQLRAGVAAARGGGPRRLGAGGERRSTR